MTEPNSSAEAAESEPPKVDLYTRNGFAGPVSLIIRDQYTPPYTRVQGNYAPKRFCSYDVDRAAFANPRALAVSMLEGDGVSIEVAWRTEAMPFAYRNVLADEVHYILSGSGRLETDFGTLDVVGGDVILVPRAVTYRFTAPTEDINEIIVVTGSELHLEAGLDSKLLAPENVDRPAPYTGPARQGLEHELVIRHGSDITSYFYDYDPVPCRATDGAPTVLRWNVKNCHGLPVTDGIPFPSRLLDDGSGRVLTYYLGARSCERPPVHHNADYDELYLYMTGPAAYGAIDAAGTLAWVPKGIIHQGPSEDVAAGYHALLIETRAALALTPAGRDIAQLMETTLLQTQDAGAAPAMS